jgi:hypothetical protein
MSVSSRTPAAVSLSLVPSPSRTRPTATQELKLAPSDRLSAFVAHAAEAGLDLASAVELGIERALVLVDARCLVADVEAARGILNRAARCARPTHELSEADAIRVRCFNARRPAALSDVSNGASVPLPDRLLRRSAGAVPVSALHPGAVEEMIGWELAATLAGRSMPEWALWVLATRRGG